MGVGEKVRRFCSSPWVILLVIVIILVLGIAVPLGVYFGQKDQELASNVFHVTASQVSQSVQRTLTSQLQQCQLVANVLSVFCGTLPDVSRLFNFTDHSLGAVTPLSVYYAPIVMVDQLSQFEEFASRDFDVELPVNFSTGNDMIIPSLPLFRARTQFLDLLTTVELADAVKNAVYSSEMQVSQFLPMDFQSNSNFSQDNHTVTWLMFPVSQWNGTCWLSRAGPTWVSKPIGAVCGLLLVELAPYDALWYALSQVEPKPVMTLLRDQTRDSLSSISAYYSNSKWVMGELPAASPILDTVVFNLSVGNVRWPLVLCQQEGFALHSSLIAIFCTIIVIGMGTLLACVVSLFIRRHKVAVSIRDQERVRRNNLIAFVSHEIRNVLQAIASVQDIILHEGTNPKHAMLLEDVNMVTNIGVVLLNDLLDMSRAEASVLKLELKPVEFRVWLKGVLSVISGLVKPGVTFSYSVDPDVPGWMQGDAVRLGQILQNVLLNSFKFTLQGSVVMNVSVAKGTLREHLITFEVVDTGKGISKEWQARLMRPYAQEHEGAAGAPGGGTGLGLALVKILCEKMDGTLKLTSAGVGLGTTTLVQVQLDSCVPAPETPNPLIPRWTDTTDMTTLSEESSAPTSPGTNNSPPRRLSSKATTLPNLNAPAITCGTILAETKEEDKEPVQYRVLVVDDLTLNRRLLAHMISSFFAVVDQAGNGKEAFEMAMAAEIKGLPYDAIVTDQEMPIMTGMESLHRMASCNVQSKFVMVCGNPDSVRDQLLPNDDITMLTKPARKEDFAGMVFPSVIRRRRRRELRRLQADVVLDGSYYGDNSRKSARVGDGSSRTLDHGSSGGSGRQPSPKRKSLPLKRETLFGPELVPPKRESFAAALDPLLLAPALSRASSSPKLKHAGSLKRDSLDPRKDSLDSTVKRDSLDPPRKDSAALENKRGSLDPSSVRKDSLDPDTYHIVPELLILTPSRRTNGATERKAESETEGLLSHITVHIN